MMLGYYTLEKERLGIRAFTKVVELIKQDQRVWKEDTLKSLFTEDQTARIMTIPLLEHMEHQRGTTIVWGDNTL